MSPDEIVKTLKKNVLIPEQPFVVDTDKSIGSWIFDSVTAKFYLDCFSQYGSQPIGWNHPLLLARKDEIADAAIHKVANSDMLTKVYAQFMSRFSKITKDFKNHFFICGGALAVENSLKAAFDYKAQKLNLSEKQVNNLDVVHLRDAFHGRSGYTLSLTNNSKTTLKTKRFPKFNWTTVTNPKITFPIDENKVKNLETSSLLEIEHALKKGNVAALIVELIQSEGGDHHFRKEYIKELRKITKDYDVMFIVDEVQTGMGMTGKLWAYQHFDIVPDMLVFGKKTQVCGFCSTNKINEIEDNVFKTRYRINSTWGGNSTDFARSTIYMDIIESEGLVENARRKGDLLRKLLANFEVSNIRGRGLILAFDLENEEERDKFFKKIKKKMLVLPCGEKSIRFRPHLDITEANILKAAQFVSECL